MELDHLILAVNDREESIAFYTEVLGLEREADEGPFAVVRVTPDLTLQLAPWGTDGGAHLAFAMTSGEFEDVFTRVRERGIPYGDSFHEVGNMRGPGIEPGARGPAPSLYVFDPSRNLVEIRHYDD